MGRLYIPDRYRSTHDIIATQRAIKGLRETFQTQLAQTLNLKRVSAPKFVTADSGLNDTLTGVEKPVSFDLPAHPELGTIEVVQSLAKWKRLALYRYEFKTGEGIYTDMDAIRPFEDTDNTHSIYVDQWDWELVIRPEDRTFDMLHNIVERIFQVFVRTEEYMLYNYPEQYSSLLPEEITFVTAQELEDLWPDLVPEEREYRITKEKKAVFISGIGHKLASGRPHDLRSPDYDDWNLNGDIILWHPILERHLELSSMGIRVDAETLRSQLALRDALDRLELPFHSLLADGALPQTVGGGIGQSRICMFFLQKAHIGEVQAGVWPETMIRACEENGIHLL